MLKFIVRRLVSYVAMLFVATSITYVLASKFLDPRSNYVALRPQPSGASIDQSLNYANVNDETPIIERYGEWLKGIVLHFDFGRSPQGEPINDQLWHRALISLELVTLATLLAIVIGIAVGVASAIRKYSLYDRTTNAISVFFLVTPRFVLALLVVLLYLGFQEATGLNPLYVAGPIQGGFVEYLRYIALPTLSLTLAGYVTYHLTQRTYLLDTINDDYVRTARAKGLRKNVAIRRHALRTSLIPT
ncbi:MAG: ABC transporter permease, partial [Nocardioidaceae bacterium]